MVWGPLCPLCTALILPAVPWHCHSLQSLQQTGGMVPAGAEGLHRTALCSQQELAATFRAVELSAFQGRDLDSCICQTVTVLSTLKLIVNKQDERQEHFQI